MPPKAKYTKEEIVKMAFQMTREKGIEAVVARELGKKLGTSSSPIFTAFRNMEELQQEVRKLAMKEFEAYVHDAVKFTPPFKWVGIKMIEFAMKEPKLFQLLYMQEHESGQRYEDMIVELGDTVEVCLKFIEQDYALNRPEAELLFKQVWIHTFAICVLAVTKVCCFTQEEISEMLSLEFQGALIMMKSGRFQVIPVNDKEKLAGGEKPVTAMDIVNGK